MSKPFKKPYYPPKSKGNGEFHHKHALGQNFLTDVSAIDAIVRGAGIGPEDLVQEYRDMLNTVLSCSKRNAREHLTHG